MKVYTKTGDKGETGIIGRRISKASDTIELIGTLDELNASLGIITHYTQTSKKEIQGYHTILTQSQSLLFSIGALIAESDVQIDIDSHVISLEKSIDLMEENLPELTNFILPGGSVLAAHVHLSRAICRKAERRYIAYMQSNESKKFKDFDGNIRKYLNRLSDWLFMFARLANQELGMKDIVWQS